LSDGTLLSNGFCRIVHGGRGDYVEFAPYQIDKMVLVIPEDELWRTKTSSGAMYTHYRCVDDLHTKVYYQRRLVSYADYRIGFYYVSPETLQDFVKTTVKALKRRGEWPTSSVLI